MRQFTSPLPWLASSTLSSRVPGLVPDHPSGQLPAAAALCGPLRSSPCPGAPVYRPFTIQLWSISRRLRNRLAHALNGNGPGGRRDDGFTRVERKLDARMLQEPLQAGRLRASGWTLPSAVADDYVLRVYDTRLQREWMLGVLAELPHSKLDLIVVGGDFMTCPHLDDRAALDPLQLRRWGPDTTAPYHVCVPPRPHLEAWIQRCHRQLPLEAPGTQFTVCCIVPRSNCPQSWSPATIRKALPQASLLLDDPGLCVEVFAVGERARVIRVPAPAQQLPPATWELGPLAQNRVLLLLRFHAHFGDPIQPSGQWVKGQPPAPPVSDLELLRVEMFLPAALRHSEAAKAAQRGLRRVAEAMQLPCPAPGALRQLEPSHHGVYAILSVPRPQALQWLRGSGCGGVYFRPFWTERTSSALAKENFSLLWVRGRLADGARLWDKVKDQPGVVGLLPGDRDLAIRVTAEARPAELQAQVQFALQDEAAKLKTPVAGQRWWRLGPLSESECWRVKDLIQTLGLSPLRDEVRLGKAGPFRTYAYFAAVGQPTQVTLDDCTWNSSAARLSPTTPPPRRSAGLPAQAQWGGARRSSPQSSPQPQTQYQPPPPQSAQRSRPASRDPAPHQFSGAPQAAAAFPSLPAPAQPADRSSKRRDRRGPATRPPPSASPWGSTPGRSNTLDQLVAQVAELGRQNAAMLEELKELRRDNVQLRQQLDRARGVHQPYATPPPTVAPPTACPLPSGPLAAMDAADTVMPDVTLPSVIVDAEEFSGSPGLGHGVA